MSVLLRAVSCVVLWFIHFSSFIFYMQLQLCNKQLSCQPWHGHWSVAQVQVNHLYCASVLWRTHLQCIHVHRHCVRKTCCCKNSQSRVCPLVAVIVGYVSCEDGEADSFSAAVLKFVTITAGTRGWTLSMSTSDAHCRCCRRMLLCLCVSVILSFAAFDNIPLSFTFWPIVHSLCCKL